MRRPYFLFTETAGRAGGRRNRSAGTAAGEGGTGDADLRVPAAGLRKCAPKEGGKEGRRGGDDVAAITVAFEALDPILEASEQELCGVRVRARPQQGVDRRDVAGPGGGVTSIRPSDNSHTVEDRRKALSPRGTVFAASSQLSHACSMC